jgi:hypothetical protein
MRTRTLVPAIILALSVAPACFAAEADDGKFTVDLRLRSESVDDEAFARGADALTLRGRFGWRTPVREGWSAFVEVEGTTHLGGEDFNSSANGYTAFPTIADPDNAELNQAWVKYAPSARTSFTLGRQRLLYDNQRFIGNVGWRQNEQTFDALDVQHAFEGGTKLRYTYLGRVQRVFGADNPTPSQARWNLDGHLLSLSHPLGPGTLGGYAHIIGNDTLPLNSHRNLGLRYSAKRDAPEGLGWLFNAEAAWQSNHASAPSNRDASYQWIEGGLVHRGHTFRAGWERLGGDGSYAFQTPFATLHAFNGWADKFLATPANGLEDAYLAWSRKFGKLTASAAWHDYRSDRAGLHYGSEWNASLAWAFAPGWSTMVKAADYRADDFARDTRKLWWSLEYAR